MTNAVFCIAIGAALAALVILGIRYVDDPRVIGPIERCLPITYISVRS